MVDQFQKSVVLERLHQCIPKLVLVDTRAMGGFGEIKRWKARHSGRVVEVSCAVRVIQLLRFFRT